MDDATGGCGSVRWQQRRLATVVTHRGADVHFFSWLLFDVRRNTLPDKIFAVLMSASVLPTIENQRLVACSNPIVHLFIKLEQGNCGPNKFVRGENKLPKSSDEANPGFVATPMYKDAQTALISQQRTCPCLDGSLQHAEMSSL